MENIPRDVLNYIVSNYILSADDFRNLSLSCKLFAKICRRNKYKSEIHNNIDDYSSYFSWDIIYKSVNFVLNISASYRDGKLYYIELNLYTRGMDHLFLEIFREMGVSNRIIYDYEWGHKYRNYLYNDGIIAVYKYSYIYDCVENTIVGSKNELLSTTGITSQMPFIRNLDLKFHITHEAIGTFYYDCGNIRFELKKLK